MLESIFVAQQATLITHGHIFREKHEKPRFHIWPLLRTYKTVEEAIARWKKHCHSFDNDSCCAPGHHFTRITQYPLNTPETYYEHWKDDSYMAQYCYLQDEHRKQAVYPKEYLEQIKDLEAKGEKVFPPSANKSIYFGDDGEELLSPDNHYAGTAQQAEYFGIFNGRGGDIGHHFRSWWLEKHGYVKDGAEEEQLAKWQAIRSPEAARRLAKWGAVIWPEGDNPNSW
jgi:hypothetical protein